MRKTHARIVTAAACALILLNACSDSSGLSASRDGSAGSTGGATTGTGGAMTTGGAIATGGTRSGSGGMTAVGGTTSTAGTGGLPGTGGLTGTGGRVGGAGGSTIDAGTTDAGITQDAGRDLVCPPVCAIYCTYGNVLDSNGCATCSCKGPTVDASIDSRAIDSRAIDVGGCHALVCPPIFCEHGYTNDANGCPTCQCNPDPDAACADLTSPTTCSAAADRCRWLVPGCGEPALPAAGCYDKTFIDCTATCPSGRSCLQRTINPCYNLDCLACGQQIGICL